MAGLDKIIEDIRSESASAVARIREEAQAEHDKAMAEARKEADAQVEKIRLKSEEAAGDLIARADSAAQLSRRRTLLMARQELISETIEAAREAVLKLPEKEYFELILKLAAGSVLPKKGEICLCRRDLDILPADFETKLAALLPEGAELKISGKEAKIDGGFILNYGGIEQNLSLDAIFEEKKDQMQDLAGKILFS